MLKKLIVQLFVIIELVSVGLSYGQGLGGGQLGATNQMMGMSSGGLGLGLGGAAGISGLGSSSFGGFLANNIISGADPEPKSTQPDIITNLKPLPPNDFQKYIIEITGQYLPLFGSSFFENLSNINQKAEISNTNLPNMGPVTLSPVSGDYVLSAGDQLMIRVWGSLEVNYRAVIDRNGLISIPKIGTVLLQGTKLSLAENVIKQSIDKYYKNYEINVTLGQARGITVYVVGQARKPGSYTLSSMSTVSTALFATGGPNANGSFRSIQIKRSGQIISNFDLYTFIASGNTQGDVRLIDGDVLVIQPALAYVALNGKINTPAIFELKSLSESLKNILDIAGGIPITSDSNSAKLERLDINKNPPRYIEEIDLNKNLLNTNLKNGDLITFYPISRELSNSVTLRGHVAQPKRVAWRSGLRIRDLIPSRETLLSYESIRLQNEVLFSSNEVERSLRQREKIPSDLIQDLMLDKQISLDLGKTTSSENLISSNGKNSNKNDGRSFDSNVSSNPFESDKRDNFLTNLDQWRQKKEERLFAIQPEIKVNASKSLIDQVGRSLSLPNFDYAVVERFNKKKLNTELIPFNLNMALDEIDSIDNLVLMPGDVVTIFSQEDISIPKSNQRVLVKIEGEVKKPGLYQLNGGETLKDVILKAGGVTADAYIFGSALFREEVRKTQAENLGRLLRKLEAESSSAISQISQSLGASTNAGLVQAKIASAQQAQYNSLQRLKSLKPEGRIALGGVASLDLKVDDLPGIRLQNYDRINIPSRPDFVYVFGSVNTESALLYQANKSVDDYLKLAGVGSGADKNSAILIRADGTAITSNSFWKNEVLSSKVLPGDTIVLPEKLDQESVWSSVVRSTMDYTQIFYQLGLGAAAIKTLRQ